MIYLINKATSGNETNYRLFETHTESILTGGAVYVEKLIAECKMEPKNMAIKGEKIQFKKWPNLVQISTNGNRNYILLSRVSEQRFKLVRFDEEVVYMDENELKTNIELNNLMNCVLKNGVYKSMDTYSISIDEKYKQHIDQKYKEFVAKSALLGYKVTFEYELENSEVKIMKYTGTSTKVIIPNFITTVNSEAFKRKNIEDLKLNEGLKYIGNKAFIYNNLRCINIPSTVEFMGHNALAGNIGLTYPDGRYKPVVKLLNSNTAIL